MQLWWAGCQKTTVNVCMRSQKIAFPRVQTKVKRFLCRNHASRVGEKTTEAR